MNFGPLTAEQATADTTRLIKEGFVVVRIEGEEPDAIWNFLFDSSEDAVYFQRSMSVISALRLDGQIESDVIESIALNYRVVRYKFRTLADALQFRASSAAR
jgi:hypothetical protein